ncbi:hypothetical protein DL770_007359 [Monosporascus sp. CRB-9-2]|nr:hypothetical protein DL770_007359 [Monosporascus sp. CRB-9-2]
MSTTPGPPEDQARLLEDALIAVRQQTALMRKCLDTPGKLMDALKCWYVNLLSATQVLPIAAHLRLYRCRPHLRRRLLV